MGIFVGVIHMLSPIIKEPIFEHTEHVIVYSIEKETQVTIWSGERKRGNKIGMSFSTGGSTVIKLDRQLKINEELVAVAEKESLYSESTHVNVQKLPDNLPTPNCLSVLYAGSNCISTWGMVPGSKVSVISSNDLLGNETAITGESLVYLNRPLTTADYVSLFSTIGRQKSIKTTAINPVMPLGSGVYAEKLPSPSVVSPLFACQRIAGVEGLLPGSRFSIYADKITLFNHCSPRPSILALLAAELKEKQLVAAQQTFDIFNLKSDISDPISVGPIRDLPMPDILEPVYEGERSIFVLYLLNSVNVEIAVDGNTIGSADYADESEFGLEVELIAGQKIKVRQGLCRNWSSWCKEIIVRKIEHQPEAPKVKEPLYACANYVQIENHIERALLKIFADGTLIGKCKFPVVRVNPHLLADQHITATQTIGKLESQHSQPVIVKNVPDLPKTEIIPSHCPDGFFYNCLPHITVKNLIPGAHVNVFWNKLLIASGEAIETFIKLPLLIQPWPGAKMHSIQKMCDHISKDSDIITAIGKLSISSINGKSSYLFFADPYEKLDLNIMSQCPVREDVKVTISSSDTSVVTVSGSAESLIPMGKTKTKFMLQSMMPGVAKITLSADNYGQTDEGGLNNGDFWFDSSFVPYELEVVGTIMLEPSIAIDVKEGDSFDLKVTIEPVPADRKVKVRTNNSHVVSVPNEVIIPTGSKSATVKGKALNPGNAYVYCEKEHYLNAWGKDSECAVTVHPAPKPPKPKIITYQQLLKWQAPFPGGKMYVQGQVYPVPNGKLKKIRNVNTNWPWRYHLWFPISGTTDDAFDPKKGYLLNSGNEATPTQIGLSESMSNGLLIVAVPSPLDTTQQGWINIELTYEI